MRKPSMRELGILVGALIATELVNADEGLPEVVVQGYQDVPFTWLATFADDMPLTVTNGTGPAQAQSALPNSHVECTTRVLAAAEYGNGSISASNPAPQPANTSLPIPVRYDNPIDISNGSSIGARYGGVSGSTGFLIFPSLAQGIWAANYSEGNYALSGYSITDLVNTWAPPGDNPSALTTVLSSLGITASMASATQLIDLTASQTEQVIAAFAWQEGFKPSGC